MAVDEHISTTGVGMFGSVGCGASVAWSRMNFVLPLRLFGAICTVKTCFVCSRSLISGGSMYGSQSGT